MSLYLEGTLPSSYSKNVDPPLNFNLYKSMNSNLAVKTSFQTLNLSNEQLGYRLTQFDIYNKASGASSS